MIIDIIGAPTAFGQRKPGVALGPDAVRFCFLKEKLEDLGHQVNDLGNVRGTYGVWAGPTSVKDDEGLINLKEVLDFSKVLADATDESIEKGHFPFIIGGDHSLSIGSVAGISKHYDNLGVIWIDAHGDINSSLTSPSGNIHGMPVGVLLGEGNEDLINVHGDGAKIKHENLVIVGARDLDSGEKAYIKKHNIECYTMTDIRQNKLSNLIEKALEKLKSCDAIHLSLDVDSLDPIEMPGTGTKVNGGLFLAELQEALTTLYRSGRLVSADLVEVNPLLDNGNETAVKAAELTEFIFGKTQL